MSFWQHYRNVHYTCPGCGENYSLACSKCGHCAHCCDCPRCPGVPFEDIENMTAQTFAPEPRENPFERFVDRTVEWVDEYQSDVSPGVGPGGTEGSAAQQQTEGPGTAALPDSKEGA